MYNDDMFAYRSLLKLQADEMPPSLPVLKGVRHSEFEGGANKRLHGLFMSEGKFFRIKEVIKNSTFIKFNSNIRKNIELSLLITVIRCEPTVYGLTDEYINIIKMLYNKYLITSANYLPFKLERGKELIEKRNTIIFSERCTDE